MRLMLSLPAARQAKEHTRRRTGSSRTLVIALILLLVLGASLTLTACSSEPSTPTVTDLLGRSVEFAEKPVRIVTTHPTATETLYRAGGAAVGRDTASRYPAEVLDLPTVGSA